MLRVISEAFFFEKPAFDCFNVLSKSIYIPYATDAILICASILLLK